LLYGADALGGVVYFIDEPYARNNTNEVTVKTQVESASMATKSQIMLKTAKNNYRLSIGGLYNNQADYQLPNGKFAKNSRFFDQAAKMAFATNKGKWSMHLRYSFSHTRSGIPGHTHDSIIDPAEFQVEDQRRNYTVPAQVFFNHFLSLENKFFFKRHELTTLVGQTFNRLTEFEEKLTIPGIRADLHNSIYTFKLKSFLTDQIFIVSGFQGMVQSNVNSSLATEQLIPNALTFDNGAFLIGYYEGKKWNFQAGLRYDIRQLSSLETFKGTAPISRNYQGLNYSLGAVRSTEKQTIRGNISSGFRAPHLSEFLADGFPHGALRYEIGSTELKAEKAVQLDLTYEFHGEHLDLIVNPFASLLSNYIYLNPLDTVISSLPVFEYAQLENGYSYGADAGWHYHPHFAHWLHLENSFSYVMIQGNDDFQVSLLPQTRISTLLKVSFPMKSNFRLNDLNIQHMYYFRQTNVAAFETASPSFQVINLGLNAQLKGNVPLNFQLGVRNLLNSRYIDHLSRLKNIDLPFPGRNFYLSIAYQLINNHKSK
jgi:iron complex outermembrane receptor protein